MKKFKFLLVTGAILFNIAAPGVKAVSSDYKFGDLIVTEEKSHEIVKIDKTKFDSLPQSQITTSTPWQPKSTFSGVSFRDLLQYAGVKGQRLRVHALNDYWVDIPMSDVTNYNILLASKIDGKSFHIRDFGPYFVIYPVDSKSYDLNQPIYYSHFVWQVDSITVMEK